MQFNTSHINVNNVWRELLIISDTKEIPEFANGVITQKQGDYEVIYYTDGLHESKQEGDTYFNWYLINSKVLKETGVETLKQKVADLEASNLDLTEMAVKLQYEQDLKNLGI